MIALYGTLHPLQTFFNGIIGQANNVIVLALVVYTHFYRNGNCLYSINSTAKGFNQHGYEIWIKLEKV
jgi:hypothetical protein